MWFPCACAFSITSSSFVKNFDFNWKISFYLAKTCVLAPRKNTWKWHLEKNSIMYVISLRLCVFNRIGKNRIEQDRNRKEPGEHLETNWWKIGKNLERTWEEPEENLERTWREPGDNLEKTWREPQKNLERTWRETGENLERTWRELERTMIGCKSKILRDPLLIFCLCNLRITP